MHNDLPVQGIGELTEREREILKLVATGTSNKDIAHQLFISSNTVKVHLRNIFAKIGVTSRTEAAVYAIHNGLLAPESPTLEDNLPTTSPSPVLGEKRRLLFLWIAISVILVLAGIISYMVIRFRSVSSAAGSIPTAMPRWRELASLPTARSGLAVAVYENKIYGIGGESAQGITGVMEQYDVAADSWRILATKPVPVSDVKAAVIGGQVYVPGGRLASGNMTDIFDSYDPGRDQWQRQAPLPVAISGYSLVAFEGRLYLFGGWDGNNYLDTVFVYDPGENIWSKRTPMPTRRAFSGAAVVEGKILVVGGYDGRIALTVSEIYYPERDGTSTPWDKGPALPEGRYDMGISTLTDMIYVVGGKGKTGVPLPPLVYTPGTNSWETFEEPALRVGYGLGLASLGNYLYVIGGKNELGLVNLTLSYQAIYTILFPVIK
jgi:DNA-binding CsgD family transcriptional regulator/N-acetylneuraminic acid mutarotase